jgi:hypothetical protein
VKANSAFWAAVRLTEFANISIDPKTWRSLFRDKHDICEARTVRALSRSRVPGDLWTVFVEGVRRYGDVPTPWDILSASVAPLGRGRKRTAIPPGRADLGVGFLVDFGESPVGPWPTRPGEVTYSEVVRLQKRTQERLRLICKDAADLGPLCCELAKVELVPGMFGPRWGGRTTKWVPFGFFPPIVNETLSYHLDQLFAKAAVGGYWSCIYQCATCNHFNVSRLRRDSKRRAPSKYCVGSPRCRPKAYREAKAVLRQRVVGEIRKLQDKGGVDYAQATVMKKYSLTRRELNALLRR